jgi:hypothetical protein
MNKPRLTHFAALAVVAFAGPALADPGHIAHSHGHSHWLALAALGSAAVIALIGVARVVLRRRPTETAGSRK